MRRPRIEVRSSFAKSLTLIAASLGFAVVQLDVTIVNVGLASIAQSLHASTVNLQWVVNAYTITFAAFILGAGALGDRVGARRVFVGGFGLFTLASAGCALAQSVSVLLAARALQGVGAAALVPSSLALLNHAFTNTAERNRAVTIWAAGASVALTVGPLVGGFLIWIGGWRSIFLINLPVGVVGLILALRFVRDTVPTARQGIDIAGQITALLTLGSFAVAIVEGGARGWSNPWILAVLGAALIMSAIFLRIEAKGAHPMLPLALFARRAFAITSVAGLLINAAFYGLIFVFSLYFQQENHLTPLKTGIAFVPMTAAVLIGNLVTGRVARLLGTWRTMAVGAAMISLGCVALLQIRSGTSLAAIGGQMMLMGFGLGLMVPPLTSALLGAVEKARSGIASGVLNSMRQSGSMLGVSVFGSLVADPANFAPGLKLALAASAGVAALACILFMFAHVTQGSLNERRPIKE